MTDRDRKTERQRQTDAKKIEKSRAKGSLR